MPDNKPKPLACSVKDAALLCGFKKSKFYSMISTGKCGPEIQKIGSRSVIIYGELEKWVVWHFPARLEFQERLKASQRGPGND